MAREVVDQLVIDLAVDGRGTLRGLSQHDAAMDRSARRSQAVSNTIKTGFAAGGIALVAFGAKAFTAGRAYNDALNTFQASTRATVEQMRQVREQAVRLGADNKLAATSAKDAAQAMTELAKGGMSVQQSMTAARGTLILAAAAQVDAATAAKIQSDALNQFGLAADQAGHVADVLANTANAASGEITDMANALTYVGPVAKTAGISLDDTATAVGLLAKNGILGDRAGTALRGMLGSLANPSEMASKGLKTLGIQAFTSSGEFVGLRSITDQLAQAQGRLSRETFLAASEAAFGREPLAAIGALAASGATGFDSMATAVGRAGGAQEVAAAKTKGLGGALDALGSQLETVGIRAYDKVAPALERIVRGAADVVPKVAAAVGSATTVVGRVIDGALSPLAGRAVGYLANAWRAMQAFAAGLRGGAGTRSGGLLLPDPAEARSPAEALGAQIGGAIRDGISSTDIAGALRGLSERIVEGGAAITGALLALVSSIDWEKYGVAAGKQAPKFLAAVALGFIAALPDVLGVLARNWKLTLIAVFTFGTGGLGGAITRALTRIPFVGSFLGWIAGGMTALSKPVVDQVFRLGGFMLRGVLEGLGFATTGMRAGFKQLSDDVVMVIREYPKAWGAKALEGVMNIGRSLGQGIRLVLDDVARWPGRFAGVVKGAGGWLLDAGSKVIGGLVTGLTNRFPSIMTKLGQLDDAVLGQVKGAGTWLLRAGEDIIGGLVRGITSKFDSALGKLRELAEKIPGPVKKLLGISSPSTVFIDLGENVVDGLIIGMQSRFGAVQSTMQALSRAVGEGLSLADLKAATARANETPVERAQLEQLIAAEQASARARAATAATAAAGGSDTLADRAETAAAAARARLEQLSRSTAAATTRAVEHARALRAAADRASQLAQRMPDNTRAQRDAKDAAQAHAAALAYQARQAERASTVTREQGAAAVKAAKAALDTATAAATKSRDASNAAAAAAKDASETAVQAAQDLAEKTAALADAVYAQAESQARGLLDVAGGALDDLARKAEGLRSAFSGGILGGTGLTDLFSTGDQLASVDDVLIGLMHRINDARGFADQLGTLAGLGLTDAMVQQIAAAGPATGGRIADALISAGPGAIANLVDQMSLLNTVATTALDPVVNTFYGAGVSAIMQLVEGIRSGIPTLDATVAGLLGTGQLILGTAARDQVLAGATTGGPGTPPTLTVQITADGLVFGNADQFARELVEPLRAELIRIGTRNGTTP